MGDDPGEVGQLLETEHLAEALGSDRFKQFLDHVPVAIAVSELAPSERVVYVNLRFEMTVGRTAKAIDGAPWSALPGTRLDGARTLAEAIVADQEHVGVFRMPAGADVRTVDAWSNIIHDDSGMPRYRLVALAATAERDGGEIELEKRLQEKDTLLREIQHRVKNNLQMITALIRLEARNGDSGSRDGFDRLAGRIDSLALLYRALSDEESGDVVDLGPYLAQIASAVLQAHGRRGIHLDMQVDAWPVAIDVAMPTGLVVNELLTNSLKHAFDGRSDGTLLLRCLVEGNACRVIVGDDGIGLAPGVVWPKAGKLSALIVNSLRQNAKAHIAVQSEPGAGMRSTITIARQNLEPQA